MEVANTLAYYDTATFTAVKSFIVPSPVNKGKMCWWHWICISPVNTGIFLYLQGKTLS
jgi:hypothetical protein